ncbi:hypothetical protein K439DRAFT_206681 [Ramaria rubella]|nr:hypothetical protein K439DRAFT_206681 [Ramaria rubella]
MLVPSQLPEIFDFISSPSDRLLRPVSEWFKLLSQCAVAVVLGLRTYAIWGRNRVVMCILLCVFVPVPTCAILLGIDFHTGTHTEQTGHDVSFRIMLLSLTSLIFDSTVLCLTILRSWQFRRSCGSSGNVLNMIVRDGTIYFSILTTNNLMNILVYYLAPKGVIGVTVGPSRAIAVVLTARFMLNLREMYYGTTMMPSTSAMSMYTDVTVPPINRFGEDFVQMPYTTPDTVDRGEPSQIDIASSRAPELPQHSTRSHHGRAPEPPIS